MQPQSKMRYEARTGIDLTVIGTDLVTPPHVVRVWLNQRGQRETVTIANYESKWVAYLVAFVLNWLISYEIWGRRNNE